MGIDKKKLYGHVVRLCKRNLKSPRVKCCAQCPFEEIICSCFPELRELFILKRDMLAETESLRR
ncbi:MAG: hypothetical protein FK733_00070 [Asgard group archaeon]|nr:hypothetical protein [Asgard group archaeon]